MISVNLQDLISLDALEIAGDVELINSQTFSSSDFVHKYSYWLGLTKRIEIHTTFESSFFDVIEKAKDLISENKEIVVNVSTTHGDF